jgi:RNA recognition motif-containing protein
MIIFVLIVEFVQIRLVTDKEGKPRGYAFIEYEKERDMRSNLVFIVIKHDTS